MRINEVLQDVSLLVQTLSLPQHGDQFVGLLFGVHGVRFRGGSVAYDVC